jgi:cytochrome P450
MTGASARELPMPRAKGCPFDPPPGLRDLQRETPLAPVRLWNGATAWVVTRHADQRAVLADHRVSSDDTLAGYPAIAAASTGGGSSFALITMDDPEHARLRRMVTAPSAAAFRRWRRRPTATASRSSTTAWSTA